jgi:hypothetical protein
MSDSFPSKAGMPTIFDILFFSEVILDFVSDTPNLAVL